MSRTKDLTGMKFNRLTVVNFSHSNKFKKKVWDCVCDCGNHAQAVSSQLTNGYTKSCGCLQKEKARKSIRNIIPKENFIDLAGEKFNRLTVVSFVGEEGTHRLWRCKCECGNERTIREYAFKNGRTKSCGCYNRQRSSEYNTKHGQSYKNKKFTPEYQAWANMVKRCTNHNATGYEYWGGRGITICDRWELFENFFADMGSKPTENHSLDRIDNEKDYSPDNCKWSDKTEQVINRRIPKNNSTGAKGVYWHKTANKYHARIGVNGKTINLGSHRNFEEAVKARVEAEEKYWKSS
ncbi:hypothetical protein J2Z83_003732 [Virgibacillus natechei]|uniref:AP2 domain-containing protein n=1 Tax=Virgibacillus natechei TaxID=1216297 RepID=A0ABS4IKX5_9BACI|nr:hypothetical protein [Virgibacillus natechei]MBP1971581.1 hypothetical protein [Virgibacillus natechei]UZD13086.1 hypothetical protein OLD84_00460 [Virgibacillus natechei]